MWIQVKISSFGCLVQDLLHGYRGATGLLAPDGGGLCAGLEGAFRGFIQFGMAFSTLMFVFSNSTDLWDVRLCKILLICVRIAR